LTLPYCEGDYIMKVFKVQGNPREIGNQIGEEFKKEIYEFSQLVKSKLDNILFEGKSYEDAVVEFNEKTGFFITLLKTQPDLMEEIDGMAETSGVDVKEFLKSNDITIEKMRDMWQKDAQQALQTDVFLKLYADERDIKVSNEDLKKKIEEIKKGAPENTDPKVFEDERWQEYIRRIAEKELAFQEFAKEIIGEHDHTEKSSTKKKKNK